MGMKRRDSWSEETITAVDSKRGVTEKDEDVDGAS